jgi:hypothetical protein
MSRWLENVLDGLVGGPSPRAGEGLESTFVHSWPLPSWVTLLLLAALAVAVVAVYLREPGQASRVTRLMLASVRLAVFALIVTMMYGWMIARHHTELPDLLVVADASASMAVVDPYEDRALPATMKRQLKSATSGAASRVNLLKSLLSDRGAGWLRQFADRYRLKFYVLGTTARVQSGDAETLERVVRTMEAADQASRLGEGLQTILESQRGRPTAAVVLLTDGRTTEGRSIGEAAQYARRKGIPLYIVGLGDERPPRDLFLADLLADDAVFLGDQVNFDFKLTGSGFSAEEVRVLLKEKGRDEPLAEQRLKVQGDGRPQSVRLSHRPAVEGETEYVVEVESLAGEVNVSNNELSQLIRVFDETIRVLYVQEYPSMEFRYLKTLLDRVLKPSGEGKAIQLSVVLQEADPGYVDLDETAMRVFPVNRDELFAYDVLIFGDVNPSFMNRPVVENIAAFVKDRGGGLLFVAGPRHTPLAYRDTALEDLFPVELGTVRLPDDEALMDESFRVRLALLGATSPQMQLAETPAGSKELWDQLPPIRWLLETPDLRPAARVLVEHPTRTTATNVPLPVICMQFVGAGRVVFHATDETYLWSRHRGSDEVYERYWMQTIRFLGRSKLLGGDRSVEMPPDRTQYYRGESVSLQVRFLDERLAPAADDGVAAVLEREDGRRKRTELQRDPMRRATFEGQVSDLPEGAYRVWLVAPTIEGNAPSRRFSVVPPPGEQARLEMDKADLESAARTSQGRFYAVAAAGRLPADLPRGRQVRIQPLPSEPVWNSPVLAGLCVALLIGEWLWRRKLGWV